MANANLRHYPFCCSNPFHRHCSQEEAMPLNVLTELHLWFILRRLHLDVGHRACWTSCHFHFCLTKAAEIQDARFMRSDYLFFLQQLLVVFAFM